MVSDQQLLANVGLGVIPALGVLSVPSLQVETKPRVDSDMPYATLEKTCLFWHLAFFSSCLSVPSSAGGSDPRMEILCG
jgi:hypothetical protein